MKKKLASFLMCLVAFAALFPLTVSADFGPKPSVNITFKNMGDEECYATLLSERDTTGPYSAWDGKGGFTCYDDISEDVCRALAEYVDTDGYYFLQTAQLCSDTKNYKWGYYPPQKFKILLYYPQSGKFAVSGIYEQYAFDSYYTVDMAAFDAGQQDILTAEKSYDYTWEIISLLCRIVLTILVEMAIALLFMFRGKKLLWFIAAVNTATQIILNVLLNIINYNSGSLAFSVFYILFEIAVFIIEAVVYCIFINRFSGKKIQRWKSVLYSLIANGASYAAGIFIANVIPGIF